MRRTWRPGLCKRQSDFVRALSRTLYQKESAAIPAWRGRVSVASAVAPGAVVNTDQMRVSLMSMPASLRPAMARRLVAPPACSASTVGPVCDLTSARLLWSRYRRRGAKRHAMPAAVLR
jgi:hypothetical protein